MNPEPLQKTSEGNPLLFVVLAVQIASSADEAAEFMRILIGRKRPRRRLPAGPALGEWLSLYRHHRRLANSVGQSCMADGGMSASEAQDAWRDLVRMPESDRLAEIRKAVEESPEQVAQFARLFCEVPFPPDEQVLRRMLKEVEGSAEQDAAAGGPFDALIHSCEGQFYVRVWLPCWILYKTYPPVLLRRARLGCDESLEQLLRLDKSAVADPVIAKRWHRILLGDSFNERKRFLRAMAAGPKGRLDAKAIRLELAGMISQMAIAMRCPVTAPEIGELFDRIERIRSGKPDVAVPVVENLAKAIQRNRTWPSLTPPKN